MPKQLWEPDIQQKKFLFEFIDMLRGERDEDNKVMAKGKILKAKLGARRWAGLMQQYTRYNRVKNPVDYVNILKEPIGDGKEARKSQGGHSGGAAI